MSTTAIGEYALLSDRHSAARSAATVPSTGCAGLASTARPSSVDCWVNRPATGRSGSRRGRGHPSLPRPHHGVGDDAPHRDRDRRGGRRAGDRRTQPGASPRPRLSPSPAAAGRVHGGRGRDRRRVRPPPGVRPRVPVARRGRRRRLGEWRGGRHVPVVSAAHRHGERSTATSRFRSRLASEPDSRCTTPAGPTRSPPVCGSQDEIAARLDDTVAAWQSWSDLHQSYVGPWHDLVHHSGRVLQALSFQPTGAICAAATTSLPEVVGGDRNWDYRYAWVRDASFTIEALWVAACPDEANEFVEYMTSVGGRRRSIVTPTSRSCSASEASTTSPSASCCTSPGGAVRAGARRQRGMVSASARRVRRTAQRRCIGSAEHVFDADRVASPSTPPVPRRARRHRGSSVAGEGSGDLGGARRASATSCTRS